MQNIYDSSKGQVDQPILNTHIDNFNKKYGTDNQLLASTVQSLLTYDETLRPSPKAVYAQIPPYDTIKEFLKNRQGQSLNQFTTTTTTTTTEQQGQNPDYNLF